MTRRLAALALLVSATALAKPQLQTFFQSTLSNTAYQQKVFNKVAKVWKQPKETPAVGKKTVVRATLARDGRLVSAQVSMASGSKTWDDAAVAAVKKAAPFDPLPDDFAYPSLEVDFHVSWVK
jgi:periplasmic protein TonB